MWLQKPGWNSFLSECHLLSFSAEKHTPLSGKAIRILLRLPAILHSRESLDVFHVLHWNNSSKVERKDRQERPTVFKPQIKVNCKNIKAIPVFSGIVFVLKICVFLLRDINYMTT